MGLLDGKVALVTGGGGGVGQGCAYALAREGVAVVVNGRTESKLQETVQEIERFGGKASYLIADVVNAEDCQRSIDHVVETYGGIDILINNAVSNVYVGPLMDSSEQDLLDALDIGPIATLRYMKAAYPHLKARGGGVIINMISGTVTRWDSRFFGIYSTGKQGIRALTRAAASEWGADGIRALNVAPVSDSPAMADWHRRSPKEAEEFYATIPMKRVGNPETDIGGGVVALCLPQNRYLTGCTIPLDGGQCLFS